MTDLNRFYYVHDFTTIYCKYGCIFNYPQTSFRELEVNDVLIVIFITIEICMFLFNGRSCALCEKSL